MSRSDKERREAERAARRAERLAQRAEQRARRKEEQARHAVDRAERLAQRAARRPSREKDLERSIEDLVDKVADKWTRKAERWIDEQGTKMFDDANYGDDDLDDARVIAEEAREEARAARREAQEATELARGETGSRARAQGKPRRPGRRPSRKRESHRDWSYSAWYGGHRSKRRSRRRGGNLYRDKDRKKICGVCAGTADYFGMDTWKIRLLAVMGLIFIPSVAVPVYFITYCLMDDKPYYRQVTDRFDDIEAEYEEEPRTMRQSGKAERGGRPGLNNQEAMRTAKDKFSDIEERLRSMETHVTSSTFELQRELNKISAEDGQAG